MLLFGIIVTLSLVSFLIGKEVMLNILINEKEDKRVRYKGKIYCYHFEEEKRS